jgi:bifunctional N-acetylglucosamine-1-phosphate-uridyltransferase/glucosamine-1-phosphate-acetyltransferase GlmU-like protein
MLIRVYQGLASRFRAFALQRRGAQIEGKIWLRAIEVPRQAHRLRLGAGVALDNGVTLIISGPAEAQTAIHLGRVYVNRHTIIDACEKIRIEDHCMIGPFCYITDHDHSAGEDGSPGTGKLLARPVIIETRAWLGAHVTVLKGVHIGAGAVIGAGSVVTKDIPAGAVAVGNPARVLRVAAQG